MDGVIHIFFLIVAAATNEPLAIGRSYETYANVAACEAAKPERVVKAQEVIKQSSPEYRIAGGVCATDEQMTAPKYSI